VAEKMPVTGGSSLIARLSTSGIPPFSGFWSKLIIILALWTSHDYLFAAIAIFASIITLAYFLSLQRRVFFGVLNEKFMGIKEAGFVFPSILFSAMIIIVGVLFPLFSEHFLFSLM